MFVLVWFSGSDASATLLKETCCGIGEVVPFSLQSTDGSLYVLFETDNTISDMGFRIGYILEGAPTTTAQVTTSKQAILIIQIKSYSYWFKFNSNIWTV